MADLQQQRRVKDVGQLAVNDSFMLEGTVYHLLKKYFRSEPYYVHLLELFHEMTFQTEKGQMLDCITTPGGHVDLSTLSFEKHPGIGRYKTAYFSFDFPVALALRVSGVPESYVVKGETVRPYEVASSILLPIGEYFQVQDDFLDFAGDPKHTGKIGTDIVDNKCSWCVISALEMATAEQRAVLGANYGRKDAVREERVKEIYEAVGLRERYRLYEEDMKTKLDALIAAVPEPEENVRDVLRREALTAFLNKIYKRTK